MKYVLAFIFVTCMLAVALYGDGTDCPKVRGLKNGAKVAYCCDRCAALEKRVAELEARVEKIETAEAERMRRRAEFQRRAKPERAIDQVREKVRRHAVKPEKGLNLNGKAVGE